MPSRLRFEIISRAHGHLSGQAAKRLILQSPLAKTWPEVDWAKLDGSGQTLGLWQSLRVWRERRGLKAGKSVYRSQLAKRGIRLTRTRQQLAYRWNTRATLPNSLRRAVLVEQAAAEAPPRPRSTRPGIFA